MLPAINHLFCIAASSTQSDYHDRHACLLPEHANNRSHPGWGAFLSDSVLCFKENSDQQSRYSQRLPVHARTGVIPLRSLQRVLVLCLLRKLFE